ncbi:hypothetical protein NE237_015557 [Protea cynaroides]|uniref:Uncharacterized protein n=1 Tax=Protea cynaroides TaxID=273540 RepID=A0A9Q0KEH3_9MAGN|nr:hypothetical protein NE237_015557 [Protea cynaroides]
MAIVRGELYVLSHGVIFKRDKEQWLRKMVAAAPASALYFESRIGFGMIELGDELYVIGGVIGPSRWNVDVNPLSDVDVLTVGMDRPTWHLASPMTQCCTWVCAVEDLMLLCLRFC